MALFTSNTWAEYASLIEFGDDESIPVGGVWKDLTLGQCKEILSVFGEEAANTSLGVYVDFLARFDILDETPILSFNFDQDGVVKQGSACPVIRTLEDENKNLYYVIQINTKKEDCIPLLPLREKWGKESLMPVTLKMKEGTAEEYIVCAFTITLPSLVQDEFALKTSFSLRIDARPDESAQPDQNGRKKPMHDQLLASFTAKDKSRGAVGQETLKIVNPFKSGGDYHTNLRDLDLGIYRINSFKKETRITGEGNKFEVLLFNTLEGVKINLPCSLKLGKEFCSFISFRKYEATINSGGYVSLLISDKEVKTVKVGEKEEIRVSVNGRFFNGEPPIDIVNRSIIKQSNAAIKAGLPPAPAIPSQQMTLAPTPSSMRSAAPVNLPVFEDEEDLVPAL